MSVAFWSIKLSGGSAVEVQPPEGYVLNLQQAALSGEGVAVIKVQTVSVEGDKIDSVIATLRSGTTDQVNLNLVFGYDIPVSFVASSGAEVYLSGYYQPSPDPDDDEYSEEDSDTDSDEASGDESEEVEDDKGEKDDGQGSLAKDELNDQGPSSETAAAPATSLNTNSSQSSLKHKIFDSDDEVDADQDTAAEVSPQKMPRFLPTGTATPSGQKQQQKPIVPAQNNNQNKPNNPASSNNQSSDNKNKPSIFQLCIKTGSNKTNNPQTTNPTKQQNAIQNESTPSLISSNAQKSQLQYHYAYNSNTTDGATKRKKRNRKRHSKNKKSGAAPDR